MHNPNSRLEAFCDGVFAIALTLLIIEIKIPSIENISTSGELWLALKHLLPSVFAFLLSFAIILITWVNHHTTLRFVDKTSDSFIYANGVLLLSVVMIPFPTSLLGATLLTDHAAPAVVLYTAVDGLGALGWFLLTGVALRKSLTRNEQTTARIRYFHKAAVYSMAFYTICAILAYWAPLTIATTITVAWIFWSFYGTIVENKKFKGA